MSIVTGVWHLILFLLHFGLYNRPLDEDKPSLDDANANMQEGKRGMTTATGRLRKEVEMGKMAPRREKVVQDSMEESVDNTN